MAKANPAYVETLYTPYFIVDDDFMSEFEQIFALKNDLVYTLRCQFVRAMYGMMCEKEKALCHPYPTILHKIEKWGYDGKQLSHIIRLYCMMRDYMMDVPLEEAFMVTETNPSFVKLILSTKLNQHTLEEAKEITAQYMALGKELKDLYLAKIDENKIDYTPKEKFIQLSNQIIKNKIILDIKGE
jgi:hypothetical protein